MGNWSFFREGLVLVKVAQLYPTLCDPTWPHVTRQRLPTLCDPMRQHARLLCLWNFPGKNTGVGSHFLLQGHFPTQGLNLELLLYRQILYHLSHQGSPRKTSTQTTRQHLCLAFSTYLLQRSHQNQILPSQQFYTQFYTVVQLMKITQYSYVYACISFSHFQFLECY